VIANPQPSSRRPDPASAAPARASTVRLLVIEDDPDQRELIHETLCDHFGAGSVELAETCAAALQKTLAAFDLILCDYNLPDGNGLDLLIELRRRCDAPVMMLTGENAADTAKEAIRRGATDYVVKAGNYLLTIPLTVEKNLMAGHVQRERESTAASLMQRNSELEQNLKQVEQLAATDPMTGCYNRRAFERIFEQLFAEAYRTRSQLACVMVDLDHFKEINDTLGHAIGDELIRLAARCIHSNLRKMDVACRYGGDEFILLLPKADTRNASHVAERILRDFIAASADVIGGEGRTMSIGVGSLQETTPPAANSEALMVATDRALYAAKESGRNRVCSAPGS
jgi:two-component system cell cycle response regulator